MEELTIKQLQDELVKLGLSEEEAQTYKTKAQIITTLKAMSKASESEEHEDEKVLSLEEKPNPSEEKRINKKWKTKAEAMKSNLFTQEEVSVLVPLDPGEKMGVVEWREDNKGDKYQVHISGDITSVQLNGYKYFIPKGVYTRVPKQVAEVISASQQQTLDAGKDFRIDRLDGNTGRPILDALN